MTTAVDVDFARLFDWNREIPCDEPRHAAGERGCKPELFATHIVEASHGIAAGTDCRPILASVCDGRVQWIVHHRNDGMFCSTCLATGRVRAFVRIVGPIAGP